MRAVPSLASENLCLSTSSPLTAKEEESGPEISWPHFIAYARLFLAFGLSAALTPSLNFRVSRVCPCISFGAETKSHCIEQLLQVIPHPVHTRPLHRGSWRSLLV